MKRKRSKNRFFQSSRIAGFGYWEGYRVFDELKPGALVTLEAEPENRYDTSAVAIYYRDFKLGYIPANANQMLFDLLDMGYEELFEARIQRVQPNEHSERQVSIIIYLREKENKPCETTEEEPRREKEA